jgi:hypothetical protein
MFCPRRTGELVRLPPRKVIMSWLLIAVTVWASIAVLLAVFIGRAVRIADARDEALSRPTVPDFMPDDWTTSTAETR